MYYDWKSSRSAVFCRHRFCVMGFQFTASPFTQESQFKQPNILDRVKGEMDVIKSRWHSFLIFRYFPFIHFLFIEQCLALISSYFDNET